MATQFEEVVSIFLRKFKLIKVERSVIFKGLLSKGRALNEEVEFDFSFDVGWASWM